jgi:thiosulfate/3-mercaptopyruvate sulfurtransferase
MNFRFLKGARFLALAAAGTAMVFLGVSFQAQAYSGAGAPDRQFLTETQWLEENLQQPDLRIIDCSYFLSYDAAGKSVLTSGRDVYLKAHIPGSIFIDLQTELSDPASDLSFTMPSAEQFAAVMSQYGVGNNSRVVIYDRGNATWAARFWWMLRASGFNSATILNGGWKKWEAENRPKSDQPVTITPASFVARPKPGLFVGKTAVVESIEKNSAVRICALPKAQFDKEHIPGSINIPSGSLIDARSNTFLPAAELENIVKQAGISQSDRIIIYCGGGVSACCDAFVLTLLGFEKVSVYDGSMEEWRKDKMPMESTK